MLSSLHKVDCPVGCIIVVVGCPHVFWFFAICVLLMCRCLQIKATFYDFSSLFPHLITMFSFVVFPLQGKNGYNRRRCGWQWRRCIFFTFFCVFELFSTYARMLMYFFSCFLWFLNQRFGSQSLRRNSKRPANRQPRPAQSVEQGEDVEVSGMLMTQVHFFGFVRVI